MWKFFACYAASCGWKSGWACTIRLAGPYILLRSILELELFVPIVPFRIVAGPVVLIVWGAGG